MVQHVRKILVYLLVSWTICLLVAYTVLKIQGNGYDINQFDQFVRQSKDASVQSHNSFKYINVNCENQHTSAKKEKYGEQK